ncbi:MAG: MFS transporter [Bacteroidetes bacterium]|nr:MFS transporter [Bacteroidota bacterium]
MSNFRIKLSLFINYYVFAVLLNSSGIAILQVQSNFGVTKDAAAWIDPCKDLSIAIASFLISSFITRFGYKRAMLTALGVISVACFIIPSLPGFLAIKVLFVVIGTCFALIKMSVYSTIGLIAKDQHDHISQMNFIESFFMVGNLTLYFVFSEFVDNDNPLSTSWLKTYYLLGGLTIVAFILLLTARLDETAAKEQGSEKTNQLGDMFQLLLNPIVVTFVFSAFFYVLIEQSIQNFLPTFNKEELLLPATLSIQMGSILAGSTALGRFLAGIVLKKLNWFYVLIGCLSLAVILILIAMPLAGHKSDKPITGWLNAPLAAYIFPLIGLVLAPIYPAINSVILNSLPKPKHGVMSGWIIIFSAIGGTTGSLLTGYIFQHYGGQTAFYFSLVPISILAILLIIFKRLQPKETAITEVKTSGSH